MFGLSVFRELKMPSLQHRIYRNILLLILSLQVPLFCCISFFILLYILLLLSGVALFARPSSPFQRVQLARYALRRPSENHFAKLRAVSISRHAIPMQHACFQMKKINLNIMCMYSKFAPSLNTLIYAFIYRFNKQKVTVYIYTYILCIYI